MTLSTATNASAAAEVLETSPAIRALRVAAAHVERTLARALEPHGLTSAQFAALQVLHEVDGSPLACSELGQRLTGVAPDVTRLLDRLETAGMVARVRDLNDRRVVHTRITEKGRDTLRAALPAITSAEEKALGELEPAERATLATLLAGVHRHCSGT